MAKYRKTKGQIHENVKSDSVNNKNPVEIKNQLQPKNIHSSCMIRKRGRPKKNLKLVVLLEKSELVESLIRDLQPGSEMASNSATGRSPGADLETQDQYQASIDDRLRFIRTFKITAELNTQSRKIDMISIPVETVSMNNEKSKTVNRKFQWNACNYIKTNTLADIFNVTSTNSIFESAFLEAATSSPTNLNSPKKFLTRTVSVSSLNSCSNLNRCPSRASNISIDEFPTDNIIRLNRCETPMNRCQTPMNRCQTPMNRCQTPMNILPAHEDYDYRSRKATQVRSDSSGYHSEQKFSDNSPGSSTVSSPKRRLSNSYSNSCLTIPSGSPPRTSPVYTEQINTAPVPMKRKCDFKTPKLPAFKRPPTRIKKSLENDTARVVAAPMKNVNRINRQQIELDDSDAISLYAESLYFDDNETVRFRNERKSPDIPKPESNKTEVICHPTNNTKQHSSLTGCPEPITALVTKHSPRKEGNLDKPLATPLTSDALSYNTIETHTSKVDQWMASAPSSKEHVNISAFIASLQKLCYLHYGRGKCMREHCRFNHNLPKNFQNALRDLNETQFKLVFADIFKLTYLFLETFDFILMYYKENNSAEDLIYMIQDILKLRVDKTPFIKKVILTLKDMGFSFVEAVDEILLTHGRKTESLLDILLMFIVEEDDCLENNWHFIDKLTKFRKNKLDYGVVCEIFQKCCNTESPSKEFCVNIYKDLIIKNHVELDRIDRNIVIKYVNVLYSFNLTDYAEQLKQNNGIGDHEVIRTTIQPTSMHEDNTQSLSNDAKSESDSSSSNSSTSNCSNSSIQSDHEQNRSPEYKECADAATPIHSNSLSGEEDGVEVGKDDEKFEEEVQVEVVERPIEVTTTTIEHTSRVLEFGISLQQNCDYTNNDLETYLNYANRNTYSSSYYRLDDTPVCNNSYSVYETMPYSSPTSENSKPIQESILTNNDELSPRSTTDMEMCDRDIMKLVANIKNDDLSGILSIMKKAGDNNMCRSFVVHTITALKNMQGLQVCKIIVDIFESLEILHSVSSSLSMKYLAKLLAFNVLPILDKGKEYGTASRILDIYAKDMESFLETKCIPSVQSFDLLSTKKLRYIFIFKIFVRDRKLKEALKLLKSSNLELFQDLSDISPNQHTHYKKRLLKEFIETSLQRDLQVARESILYLILSMDSLKKHVDLEKYLNQLMVKLLNSYSTHKSELLGLLDNIMNGWFKFLKNSILRGIFVQTFYDIPERKLMDLFNICEEKRIYSLEADKEGIGNSIDIPRNLVAEEIQFMLHIQFHKICISNFPLENIIISTERQMEMDEYTNQINIFTNSMVDRAEMIRRIQNVFSKFKHFPSRDKINTDTPGIIGIPLKDAQHFFKPYRSGLPFITKYR